MSSKIRIERAASPARLAELGTRQWPVWEKEASRFPWHYASSETCHVLEGTVTVTPEGGAPVHFGAGDVVTFPAGLSCVWEIHTDLRKHYRFD